MDAQTCQGCWQKGCQSRRCRLVDLMKFEEIVWSITTTFSKEAQHIKECMQEPMMHIFKNLEAITK